MQKNFDIAAKVEKISRDILINQFENEIEQKFNKIKQSFLNNEFGAFNTHNLYELSVELDLSDYSKEVRDKIKQNIMYALSVEYSIIVIENENVEGLFYFNIKLFNTK